MTSTNSNFSELLVHCSSSQVRAARVDAGQLEDLWIDTTASKSLVGNIYLAKVVRIVPGLDAAFLDFGEAKNGFMHLRDLPIAQADKTQPELKISQRLHEGEYCLVQVSKDAIGNKGARLTMRLSLVSRNLVFTANTSSISVSNKITDSVRRDELRVHANELRDQSAPEHGLILRTNSQSASSDQLKTELEQHCLVWQQIQQARRNAKKPGLVFQDLELLYQIVRDWPDARLGRITIDDSTHFARLRNFVQENLAAHKTDLVLHESSEPIFNRHDIENQIQAALQSRVDLPSGAELVIQPTEALTVIDVNSASYLGNRSGNTPYETNLEAAQVIARQIRVRNLGGIIIIDFIDMPSARQKKSLLQEFKLLLASDAVESKLIGMTELGLVELTRRRTRASLEQLLYTSCDVCHGQGQIKTVESISYEILSELYQLTQKASTQSVTISASEAVIDCLLETSKTQLSELELSLKRPIELRADPVKKQQEYDILPI